MKICHDSAFVNKPFTNIVITNIIFDPSEQILVSPSTAKRMQMQDLKLIQSLWQG